MMPLVRFRGSKALISGYMGFKGMWLMPRLEQLGANISNMENNTNKVDTKEIDKINYDWSMN